MCFGEETNSGEIQTHTHVHTRKLRVNREERNLSDSKGQNDSYNFDALLAPRVAKKQKLCVIIKMFNKTLKQSLGFSFKC